MAICLFKFTMLNLKQMKKKISLLTLFFGLFVCGFAWAEDAQTITLKDGSQIKGNLVGVSNGVYTIHTPTLGDIKVSTSTVTNISSGAAVALPRTSSGSTLVPSTSSNDDLNQRIQNAQGKLMNDPDMMREVTAMAQDPELMKLLSDPTLTQAVMSHDVKAIEGNPKAQELMNNPKMKVLLEELRSKTSQ
jgi:hypothetical protein